MDTLGYTEQKLWRLPTASTTIPIDWNSAEVFLP